MDKQFDLVGVFGGRLVLLDRPTGKWDNSITKSGTLWEVFEGSCAASLNLKNETVNGELSIEILVERKVGSIDGNTYIQLVFYNQTNPPRVFEMNNLNETLVRQEIFGHH